MALPADITISKVEEFWKRGIPVIIVAGMPIAKGTPEDLEEVRSELGLEENPLFSVFPCNAAQTAVLLRRMA